jgi:hypothetical protein
MDGPWDVGGSGYLTTDHPSSSHGLPVVVADDGQVLGPAEVAPLSVGEWDDDLGDDIYRRLTAEQIALVEAARQAGYRINP